MLFLVRGFAMSEVGTHTELEVPVYVDNDFDIDQYGVCYLVNLIYVGDEESATEVRVELNGVIESLSEFYGDINGYQHLYSIAHELSRQAEILRNRAGVIEDSDGAVGELFDLPDE